MNDALTELQATVTALRAEVDSLKAKLALMEEVITVRTLPDGRHKRSVECETVVVLALTNRWKYPMEYFQKRAGRLGVLYRCLKREAGKVRRNKWTKHWKRIDPRGRG